MTKEKIDKIRDKFSDKLNEIHGFFEDFRFLSNYHLADVYYDGIVYPSNEHSYQAAKSLDNDIRKAFLCLSCGEARKCGQKIRIREDWEDIKIDVMHQINLEKFSKHKDLKQMLKLTEGYFLEESNWWHDNFWGNCICSKCESIDGQNNLGKILMKIRDNL